MQFELSADQQALRDAARDLLDDVCSHDRVRAFIESNAPYDAAAWEAVVAQGWPSIAAPAHVGGLGLGLVEIAVVAEQVGRHVAPVPFVSTALASTALVDAGVLDVAAGLIDGSDVGCVAWGGLAVVDASAATWCVVVDADSLGVSEVPTPVEVVPGMDLTRRLGRIDATSTRPIGDRVMAERAFDRCCAIASVSMLGASERMLEESVAYAKTREQFGRPIGSFQAVKHRLADALVDVEGMRSAAYYAAWAVQESADDASLGASTAKAWCSDASARVMDSALQVHGGIGFTWEHDLHLFLKRAHLDQVQFGDATYHRRRIAQLVKARIEAGASIF